MLTIKDIKVLPFLPQESNKSRTVFNVLTCPQQSLLGFIVGKAILLLNILSIIIVMVADVRNDTKYESIYRRANWIAALDLFVYLSFFAIFALKLITCFSQTPAQLGNTETPRDFMNNLPVFFRKLFAFLFTPWELAELVLLLVYGVIFWPATWVINSFEAFLFLSFYMRCFKMALYSRGWRTFFKILYRGRQPMIELASLVAVLILIFGVTAYLSERFTGSTETKLADSTSSLPFKNMLDGVWWAVVTITTTGYGEYFTVTAVGRLVSIITMFTGFLYMAMPISIINNFYERYLVEEEARIERWRADVRGRLQDKLNDERIDLTAKPPPAVAGMFDSEKTPKGALAVGAESELRGENDALRSMSQIEKSLREIRERIDALAVKQAETKGEVEELRKMFVEIFKRGKE